MVDSGTSKMDPQFEDDNEFAQNFSNNQGQNYGSGNFEQGNTGFGTEKSHSYSSYQKTNKEANISMITSAHPTTKKVSIIRPFFNLLASSPTDNRFGGLGGSSQPIEVVQLPSLPNPRTLKKRSVERI